MVLSDKVGELARKKNDLEAYLGGLAKKLFIMLEGNLFYPTDLLSLTHHRTVGLTSNCVYRILPELRRGDQSSGDRLGPHQFFSEGRGCYERAPTGILPC